MQEGWVGISCRCEVRKVEMYIKYPILPEADVGVDLVLKDFECQSKEFEFDSVFKKVYKDTLIRKVGSSRRL